jgi:hypothetical protein
MIEQLDAKLLQPATQELHIVGTAKAPTVEKTAIVARKRVAPIRQSTELTMYFVNHRENSVGLGQAEPSLDTTIEDFIARCATRRYVNDRRIRRCGCAARSHPSFINEDD